MNMNHCCTRFFSNLWEINNAWLIGDTYISGNLVPFPGSNIIAALGTATNPFSTVNANTLHNKYGEIKINDLGVNGPLTIDSKENQMVTLNLSYDSTLHLTPQGQLSVVPHIITNADIDLRERPGNPVKIIYDDTEDAGAEVLLDYHEDDFKVEDGKLETIEPTWKGFGALKVGGISDTDFLDEFLEEDLGVPKLKAVRLQTTSDFSQTTGKLQIAPKGIGQIPYYTLSGLGADEGLYYNSVSNTLSTNRILLQTSFMLTPNDVPTKAYLSQYIQAAEVLSGLDLLEEIPGTNRRELKVRTNPFSMRVNATNQLEVNTGNTMKQDADGIDVKHDLSIKEDIAFGIGVNVDNVTIQVGPNGIMGNYQVMYPLQRAMNEISLQSDENSLQVGTLGLAVNLSETGALQVEPGLGIGIKCDPLGPMFRDLAGLDLRLAPVSGLMKASKGLSVQVDPTGALSIDGSLGLDVRVDGVTITKTTAGLQGMYRGDVDGDITVTAAGIILCNISAGRGLQKIGTVISLLPEIEDKLDQVDDALDGVEEAKNMANNARTVADTASDVANTASRTAGDLANKLGDLSSVVDTVDNLARNIGISVGTSVLTSGVTTAISAGALGLAAQNAAQNLISNNAAKVIGVGALFAAAFGGIAGAIAGAFNKKGNQNTYISYNSYSNGGMKERESSDEEDTYYYGYSITCGTDYSVSLYPDRTLNPCTITPLLGSGLQPVESTSSRTGQLTVAGGLGISGNIYAGGSIFSNNLKVATESFVTTQLTPYATQDFVTNKNYITSSALTPYLLASTASSTYQPIITAGAGLSKTTNTISLNPDVSISTLDVGTGMFSAKRVSWVQPTLTNMNNDTFLASSQYAPEFAVKAVFDDRQVDRWLSLANYLNALPKPGVTVTNLSSGTTLEGEWIQINCSRPVIVDYYQIRSSSYIVGRSPASWTVLGSNDNQVWNIIESRSGIVWQSTLQYKSYSMTNGAKYQYIRLVFTSLQSTTETILSLNRLQLSGYYEELNSRSNTFTWNGLNIATTADISTLQTAINGKQAIGDYATNSALTSGLASKQGTLSFTLPLSNTNNTVSIDISNIYR